MTRPTLHLLMGLPGAGKSTLAQLLHELTGAEILSSDELRLTLFKNPCFSQEEHDRLYGILDHNLHHLLEHGQSAIYDANLNRKQHRKEKYELAKKNNARVILWWVITNKDIAKRRRVAEQNARLLPVGETSERMFERIAMVLETPSKEEPVLQIEGTDMTVAKVRELLESYMAKEVR